MMRQGKKNLEKTIVTQQGDIIQLSEQEISGQFGLSFQGVVTEKQEKRPYIKSGRYRGKNKRKKPN